MKFAFRVALACATATTACSVDDADPCAEGEPFAESTLRARVETLAAQERGGRLPGSAGDEATRDDLRALLGCFGLEAPEGGFVQPFVDGEGRSTGNVVGILRGGDPEVADEVIVLGAHHDHLGQDETGVYAGANDDASGVAALLSVAQAMAARDTPPRRTVVFAMFGAEELDLDGSSFYVENPPPGLSMDATVFMIQLDMVGTYAQAGQVYALDAAPGTRGRAAVEAQLSDFPDLEVNLDEPGDSSDQVNFCDAGVPTLFFHTPDEACYHQTCDTPENLDDVHLAMIAELVDATVRELADSDADLAAERGEGCPQAE